MSEYRDEGILPEAMLNFLAQLGWNDGTEQDIFTKEELIKKFSLDRVQKSGARFDEQRLLWLNGQWIRRLDLDDLYTRIENFWGENAQNTNPNQKKQVLTLVKDRLKTLADLPAASEYFFEKSQPKLDMIAQNKQLKKLAPQELADTLETIIASLDRLSDNDWNADKIQATLNSLLEETQQKPGVLFQLIRIIVTWAPFSPSLNDTLATLGKYETEARLKVGLGLLKNLC